MQNMNAPRLNWRANLTCYKCGEKGILAQEYPHIGTLAIDQRQQTPIANTQQANYTGPTLFPAKNSTFFQTITAETPIMSDMAKPYGATKQGKSR